MKKILNFIVGLCMLCMIGGMYYLTTFPVVQQILEIIGIIICSLLILLALLFVLFLVLAVKEDGRREKAVIKYLDECDEKLKQGLMSERENEFIHIYYAQRDFMI